MLNRFAKFFLVVTAVAPLAFTWAFADWRSRGPHHDQVIALVVALGLGVLCRLIMLASIQQIPENSFVPASLKHADAEVVGFLVAYLLPLVSTSTQEFDYAVLAFVATLLGIVVWASQSYSFNPILTMMGFHFYEVSSRDGMVYMLITNRALHSCADVSVVGQLSGSVLLDKSKRE